MRANLNVGQRVKVDIEKLSLGGDGIARVRFSEKSDESRYIIFVPYASPGDEVEIQISEIRKNFAKGEIKRVIKSSPYRTVPECAYFFTPLLKQWCGGCNFQHLKYEFQIKEKFSMFKETLEKLGGISGEAVSPVLPASNAKEWRYRNKIQLPFGRGKHRREAASGFFAPRSHQMVPIEDCLIHPNEMMELAQFVLKCVNEWHLEPYFERDHTGWLRHLLIRQAEGTGEMLAIFVTLNDLFPHKNRWIHFIKNKFPKVVGLCQNINTRSTNVILGEKWRKIFGQDFLIESLDTLEQGAVPLKLKVSASSFFQVNTSMAEELYRTVKKMLLTGGAQNTKLLLDLYCGVGGIALTCAPHFGNVIGVDEVPSSISDAQFNARCRSISNCEFYCSDAGSFLRNFSSSAYRLPLSAVVLDPPRAGCSEETLKLITKAAPKKIVYVSCDPSTLARDLKFLASQKYSVRKVQPVDLFPQSSHIESVSLLEK